MLRLLSKITITQQPNDVFTGRNTVYILTFLNEVEVNSTWQNLTDTGKIILPRKAYITDEHGNRVNWFGQTFYGNETDATATGVDSTVTSSPSLTGNRVAPIIQRGDKIQIELGYNYPTQEQAENIETEIVFVGYISKINPRMPVELTLEDRMWQLKQVKVPNKVYSNTTYTVQKMIREMLDSDPRTKDISLVTGGGLGERIETNIGDEFRTQDETIAGVLERLKKDAHLNSFFRNIARPDGSFVSELRCSGIVYYPSDRRTHTFSFQKNIISDNLEYNKLEDLKLGAKCYSLNKEEVTNGTNKNGSKKIKHKRLETFVGEQEGEIRTLFFWDVHTEAKLKELGERELRKFYYEGFTGKFTTFGIPFVKHGDSVILQDNVLPERNGEYLVKGVTRTFGQGGYRQEIELHLKLSVFSATQINNGL